MPDRVLAPQLTFLAFELDQADQKFLIVDEFLFSIRERINSWEGSGKLKVLSFEILTKDVAYILSSLGFFCLFFYRNKVHNVAEVGKPNLDVVRAVGLSWLEIKGRLSGISHTLPLLSNNC